MKVLNLTPHEVVMFAQDGSRVNFPPSGWVLRLDEAVDDAGGLSVGGVWLPVVRKRYGRPYLVHRETGERLPFTPTSLRRIAGEAPQALIVSGLALEPAWSVVSTWHGPDGRMNVLAPDTGPEGGVRDENGRIRGSRRFLASSSSSMRWPRGWIPALAFLVLSALGIAMVTLGLMGLFVPPDVAFVTGALSLLGIYGVSRR